MCRFTCDPGLPTRRVCASGNGVRQKRTLGMICNRPGQAQEKSEDFQKKNRGPTRFRNVCQKKRIDEISCSLRLCARLEIRGI